MPDLHNTERPNCWKTHGVWGDRSCPELIQVIHCHNCHVYAMAGRKLLDRAPDEIYMREWRERLAEPHDAQSSDQLSLVVFSMDRLWFALEVTLFRENGYMLPIRRVPGRSNRIFRGIANLRGELLLAYSLRSLLHAGELKQDHHAETGERIMVCEFEGKRYLFDVDVTLGVVRVPGESLSTPPANVVLAASHYTKHLLSMEHAEVALLDSLRVFTALEKANHS